jgi:UDP-2,4-diacetamido-2,4,6-trideoxy-beta-L-altropyranose hydrolase
MTSSPSSLKIALRRATKNDCDSLFVWRNHPSIRQFSGHSHEIKWEAHCEWFEKALANKRRVLIIAECAFEGTVKPLGVLRYDFGDSVIEAVISVYLVPESMGKGFGVPLLNAGTDWIKAEFPFLQRIKADVLPENKASIKTFERAGFHLIAEPQDAKDFVHYELDCKR